MLVIPTAVTLVVPGIASTANRSAPIAAFSSSSAASSTPYGVVIHGVRARPSPTTSPDR